MSSKVAHLRAYEQRTTGRAPVKDGAARGARASRSTRTPPSRSRRASRTLRPTSRSGRPGRGRRPGSTSRRVPDTPPWRKASGDAGLAGAGLPPADGVVLVGQAVAAVTEAMDRDLPRHQLEHGSPEDPDAVQLAAPEHRPPEAKEVPGGAPQAAAREMERRVRGNDVLRGGALRDGLDAAVPAPHLDGGAPGTGRGGGRRWCRTCPADRGSPLAGAPPRAGRALARSPRPAGRR